ncbi:WD repeat domain-containing protein [Colletotrichum sojae]|uniref:WD repeat domain-containing protein n=1 Tax=Colletotrichum sojae TaxID=2175907 RepID=A0A8H6IYX1_9PEZI|nr:WD repeat domain-containing protein [Colletotrichum sojae]
MASPQLLSTSFQAGLGDLPVELIQLIASYLTADAQETYVEVHEASSSNEAQTQSISGSSLDSAGSVNSEAKGKSPRTQGQDTICDLKNLTITCKGFYEIIKPVLYAQGKYNDWHALR